MKRLALLIGLTLAGLAWVGAGALAADPPTIQATSQVGDVFQPSKVTIRPGQTVHWHNHDGQHNVCFNATGKCMGGTPVTHDPSFDHWDAQFTFKSAGTFHFFCENHSDGQFGMVGRVIVDGKAPVITGLSKSGKTWTFTLSEAAKVVADVKKDKPNAPRTQIFSRQYQKGTRTFTYAGTNLQPGTYVLRLRATDAAGNRSAPATKRFTKS